MISAAVMVRELRVEARRAWNYRLRCIIAGAGTLLIGLMLATQTTTTNAGLELFATFHRMMMVLILVMGPVFTADCISRERREGTLPLLFLTPLTGAELVKTKFAAQFLRAAGLWLALIPLVSIPVMAGGVAPEQIAMALVLQFALLFAGLSSGMVCSVFANGFLLAAMGGIVGALVLSVGVFAAGIAVFSILTGYSVRPEILEFVVKFGVTVKDWNPRLLADSTFRSSFAAAALLLIFLVSVILRWMGARLQREQAVKVESARRTFFRRVFLNPLVWKQAFRRSMERKMKANPLIWLEYRTAWSRAARWVLVGAAIMAESFAISTDWVDGSLARFQVYLLLSLLLVVTFTAANSFQNERQTGAFELLLVAPFTVSSLLRGRLSAVWSYYRPVLDALAIFVFFMLEPDLLRYHGNDDFSFMWERIISLVSSFATVPLAGIYFALRYKQFAPVFLLTALAAVLGPFLLWDVVRALDMWGGHLGLRFAGYFMEESVGAAPRVLATLGLHALLCVFFFGQSYERLRTRVFAS